MPAPSPCPTPPTPKPSAHEPRGGGREGWVRAAPARKRTRARAPGALAWPEGRRVYSGVAVSRRTSIARLGDGRPGARSPGGHLFALVVFGIAPPASPLAALGFAASLVGAFLVAFSLDFLLMILAFWTYSAGGIIYAKRAGLDLLAGSIVPLTLFPDWLRGVALALPFQSLAYTPISIYLGRIGGAAIWWSILVQLGWATVLVLLTRLVWLRALRRLTIQGG